MGTLIVSLILGAMVAAIVVRLLNNKRKGRSNCGCGCSTCHAGKSCCK